MKSIGIISFDRFSSVESAKASALGSKCPVYICTSPSGEVFSVYRLKDLNTAMKNGYRYDLSVNGSIITDGYNF